MPIDGWSGNQGWRNRPQPAEPRRLSQMTETGYALALARAQQDQDLTFASKIRDWRLQEIRAELHDIERRLSKTDLDSLRYRATRAAYEDAIASLIARDAVWWLEHGDIVGWISSAPR